MTMRPRKDRGNIRTVILTLRLTEQEMLRFKLAAINMRTHRAKLVRERIHDLIGMAPGGAGSGIAGKAQTTLVTGIPVKATLAGIASTGVPAEAPLNQGGASTGVPAEAPLTHGAALEGVPAAKTGMGAESLVTG